MISLASQETSIGPYPQEALLIDSLSEISADRALCTSPGVAQFAEAAARAWPLAVVACTYLDLYRAKLALDHWHDLPRNLQVNSAARAYSRTGLSTQGRGN